MKKKIILTAFLFVALQVLAKQHKNKYYATEYGMKANSGINYTSNIQSLIDKISTEGGGILCFPKGNYVTGSFELKTGVRIWLQKGAVILGSVNPSDYKRNKKKNELYSPNALDNSALALVVANDARDIGIYGDGTIDGQGRELALNIDSLHHIGQVVDPNYNLRRMRPNETARPKLFRFSHCQNVEVSGVTLRNSACWGVTLDLCTNVRMNKVKVFNRAFWNNDGIDITDCRNVQITQCNVDAADDGICLKSYYPGNYNDSIYIADCRVCSSANAVKIGTASHGGFKNIEIRNINVYDTFRSAIAIETVDGGDLENVKVVNIKAKNTGNAIFIRLGHRKGEKPGILRNIHIKDLNVEVSFGRPDIDYDMRGPDLDFFHNPFPSSITGVPGRKVENVIIENVNVIYPGRASKGMAYIPLWRLNQVPEQIGTYPEFSMFGELPAWGFYVRHVQGIVFRNVTLKLKDEDFRPAFIFDDVDDIKFENLNLSEKKGIQVVLKNSTRLYIDNNIKWKKID